MPREDRPGGLPALLMYLRTLRLVAEQRAFRTRGQPDELFHIGRLSLADQLLAWAARHLHDNPKQ